MPYFGKGGLALAAAFALYGCLPLPPPPQAISTPFSPSDFASWQGGGPSGLKGQAFMKTVGGDVKTCAGAQVVLLPATPYNLEIVNTLRSGREVLESSRSTAANQYDRFATCDAQGNFQFSGLPQMAWIVWTDVTWGIPTGSAIMPVDKQGGRLIRQISLQPGDNQVVMTDSDFVP